MAKYYEVYKTLMLMTALSGLYSPNIEKAFGPKWYIKALRVLSIFPAVCMPVYVISSAKYVFFDEGVLLSKIYGIVVCTYSLFSAFNVYSYYYHRNDFNRVFELWDSLFEDELYPEDRQELLRKNRKITNGWLMIFGGFTLLSTSIYSAITYFNPMKKLDHPTGIPYRHQTPDFELIATLELMISYFGFATLITYDSMAMALISLEEAQFVHLKKSLGRIIGLLTVTDTGNFQFDPSSQVNADPQGKTTTMSTRDSEENFQVVEEKIRIWIRHHCQVLRFHDELRHIYYVPLSVKFFSFAIFICLCGFLTVTGGFNAKDAIMSTVFCCNNFVLFYVNIQFADSIAETAESMFDEAFAGDWHFYPKRFKSIFQFILMRSHRPVQYMAFRIYPLSSRSFLKILTSAYSFFTFLLHVNRKKS